MKLESSLDSDGVYYINSVYRFLFTQQLCITSLAQLCSTPTVCSKILSTQIALAFDFDTHSDIHSRSVVQFFISGFVPKMWYFAEKYAHGESDD